MNPMKEFVDHHDAHVESRFNKFVDTHAKNYETEAEKENRMSTFRYSWDPNTGLVRYSFVELGGGVDDALV